MKRNGRIVRLKPSGCPVLSYLGLLFATACSQAPAFTEQALDDIEYKTNMGESDSTQRGANKDPAVRENSTDIAITRNAVVEQIGTSQGVTDSLPFPGSTVVEPPSHSNADKSRASETPSSSPVVVITNPAPLPTPASTPRPGILRQQTIVQPEKGKVDIVWVIDNSGSMAWAQQALAAKFESFASKLTEANIDFHLGITTTTMCDPSGKLDEFCPHSHQSSTSGSRGNLVATPSGAARFLSSDSSSIVTDFRSMAMVGIRGSSLEQGLSAAKFTVQKSALGQPNEGFLRTDARLSVVVLSDEEDDGVGLWGTDAYGNPITDYYSNSNYPFDPVLKAKYNFDNQHMTAERFVEDLNTLKGSGMFQVNAITGIKTPTEGPLCGIDANQEAYGPREAGTNYIKAATLTGGTVQNICADWTSILSNIGQSTVELTTRIQLESAPFPGTLEVSVDGTVWSTGYEFDAASNAVVFKTLPPYGAEVVVSYHDIVQ